jgi:cell division protein FtsL
MSAIRDVLSAVKDVLLLQSQVESLEKVVSEQSNRVDRLAVTVTDIDKRLYALERIIDLGARQSEQKRITDQ